MSSPIVFGKFWQGGSLVARLKVPRLIISSSKTCQAWRNGNKGSSTSTTHHFDQCHVALAVDVIFFEGGFWERSGTLRKWYSAVSAEMSWKCHDNLSSCKKTWSLTAFHTAMCTVILSIWQLYRYQIYWKLYLRRCDWYTNLAMVVFATCSHGVWHAVQQEFLRP